MGKKSKWEYFRAIYPRYRKASSAEKTQILEEFCEVCGYNRKYAITKLNGPFPEPNTPAKRHKRCSKYTSQAPVDPASHLGGVGLPLVSAAKSAPAALAALGQKTLFPLPTHRTATAPNLCAPDRSQIQSQKNPAQTAPLRTYQARHTAQTPYPHQNRLLERHHSRLYRNRPSLPFRQLRKRRVRALA